jgi:integrase/recombinase XerD
MFFRKLESKLNTQNQTYWVFGYTGKERVRKPLGTERAGVADTRVEWIKRACEEGATSTYWAQLKECLPLKSFTYFAEKVGYKDAPAAEPKSVPTWTELLAAYTKRLERPIESGKRAGKLRAQSTKICYAQVFSTFAQFLLAKNITKLSDITVKVAREDFQDWRVADITAKANHRVSSDKARLPGRYVLDVAVLCGIFKFAVEQEMIGKSPFRYVGKPGEDAENGASPFSKTELDALVRNAGGDLLSVLVLLRTGLRRSDAIRLQWKHVGPAHISLTAQKNGNKVRVPMSTDLAEALDTVRNERYGKIEADEYANEFVLQNPYTQKAFDTGKKLYERIQNVGERAGVKRAHPHRFRDSFAKDCFLKGCTVAEVAAYLGDNPETVSAHYGEMDADRLEHADKKFRAEGGLLKSVDFSEMEEARKLKVVTIGRKKQRAA